jgi:hypothetical protein
MPNGVTFDKLIAAGGAQARYRSVGSFGADKLDDAEVTQPGEFFANPQAFSRFGGRNGASFIFPRLRQNGSLPETLG